MNWKKNSGFSLIELITSIGVIILLGVIIFVNLSGRRSRTELNLTVQEIATLLRQAQSWSVAQASSTSWGVYFSNVTTPTASFAIFYGSVYSTSTDSGHYRLPASVRYVTSTLAVGSTSSIVFARLTGLPSVASSIALELVGGRVASTTIFVNQQGAISY